MTALGRRRFLGGGTLGLLGAIGVVPRALPAAAGASYEPGERVDAETFVLDARLQPARLATLLGDRLTALWIFGGAGGGTPPSIWCDDSAGELALHGSLRARFGRRGLGYLPVAVPPVYREARFGFDAGAFLARPDDSPEHRAAVAAFVDATEQLRRSGTIPFDIVYFDPRFRLLDNPAMGPHAPGYGTVHPWQGRFKWKHDDQAHGTPTLWLLSGDGTVLREPFWGNVHHGPGRRLRYSEADVAEAIEEILGRDREGGR